MLDETKFEMSCEQVAQELGLTVQQVRWAFESGIRKLRQSKELREALVKRIEIETFDGEFTIGELR